MIFFKKHYLHARIFQHCKNTSKADSFFFIQLTGIEIKSTTNVWVYYLFVRKVFVFLIFHVCDKKKSRNKNKIDTN